MKKRKKKRSTIKDYPAQWQSGERQIEIKTLARWTCEHCGMEFHEDSKAKTEIRRDGRPMILTVHHINGVKEDLRWENLVALCQRCHMHFEYSWRPGELLPPRLMDEKTQDAPKWIKKRGLPYTLPRIRQLKLF